LPLAPVDPPSDAIARAIAALAQASTVRVSAATCGFESSGSGVVYFRRYVVTNAHVVAGSKEHGVRITDAAGQVDARVVLFDPALDVAVLYAPDLRAVALRFAASDPARGTVGAAIGYPGGGSLTIVPAAVTGSYAATGRDIYDKATVRRQILELRAQIERGDSGGPFVLKDGTIGGLVFAEAKTDPDVGYALSPSAVAVRVGPAVGRTAGVATGECVH
jgi:S1-C subfamily serine protease